MKRGLYPEHFILPLTKPTSEPGFRRGVECYFRLSSEPKSETGLSLPERLILLRKPRDESLTMRGYSLAQPNPLAPANPLFLSPKINLLYICPKIRPSAYQAKAPEATASRSCSTLTNRLAPANPLYLQRKKKTSLSSPKDPMKVLAYLYTLSIPAETTAFGWHFPVTPQPFQFNYKYLCTVE